MPGEPMQRPKCGHVSEACYPLLVFDPLTLSGCAIGNGVVAQGFQGVVDFGIQVRDCSQITYVGR